MRKREHQQVEALSDIAALSCRGAELFVSEAAAALAARERFTVAISGGSTPRTFFRRLATEEFRSMVPWESVHIFWADERCVPPDHPDSNYGGALSLFLDRVPLPKGNIHRVRGELSPEEAATVYEGELRRFFGTSLPVFDLVLLGMGEDGHTASLFPGSPVLDEIERLAVAVYAEKIASHRVTLTLPVLNGARRVLFLVSGREKREIVQEVLEGDHAGDYPAGLVDPPQGSVTWLLDKAAASNLSHTFW